MKNIEIFYPSFTKKAVTFTIDDGNIQYDSIFLDIVRPAGIKGTFNLCTHLNRGKEDLLRELYRGYEIANHCKYHPFVNYDGAELVISDERFDPESADERFIYRVEGMEGFFWQMKGNGWRQMVFELDFIRYVDEGLSELNAIFGEGAVRDFVWPYGEQSNESVKDHVRGNYRSVRRTGCLLDTTGFALPDDLWAWTYNANHDNLLEVMEIYDRFSDDGELKMFSFGVHSIDFERFGKWDDLREFANKYGKREDVYWYATVGEIFDYKAATESLYLTDCCAENRSNLDLYLTVDGIRTVIHAGECVVFEKEKEI